MYFYLYFSSNSQTFLIGGIFFSSQLWFLNTLTLWNPIGRCLKSIGPFTAFFYRCMMDFSLILICRWFYFYTCLIEFYVFLTNFHCQIKKLIHLISFEAIDWYFLDIVFNQSWHYFKQLVKLNKWYSLPNLRPLLLFWYLIQFAFCMLLPVVAF